MSNLQITTPVVLLIFNRPDVTGKVFEEIRRARPTRLLVVADGPRLDRSGEAEQCAAARSVIQRVDWPCEVLANFSDVNLGCKKRVSSGLDWVFDLVEEAIILEDDCVPHPDFFRFCQIMLHHYRNDKRIMMICGTNFLVDAEEIETSYFFSNYYPIWGWATWRRAWKLYDVDMKAWDGLRKREQLRWIFSYRKISRYYQDMFDLIYRGFDTWDIQWWFTCVFNHGLSIVPKYNLISNQGATGTHSDTQRDLFTNLQTYGLDLDNISHPAYTTPDHVANRKLYQMSHPLLDLSVRAALKEKKYKRALKAALPTDIIRRIGFINREFRKLISRITGANRRG